ncbi:hypothetical protein [Mycoplasmopsis pullorum]|nr:hypothetical protein [Mycoplasmopsis pullorum]
MSPGDDSKKATEPKVDESKNMVTVPGDTEPISGVEEGKKDQTN